jgi:hypothetical protein
LRPHFSKTEQTGQRFLAYLKRNYSSQLTPQNTEPKRRDIIASIWKSDAAEMLGLWITDRRDGHPIVPR